MLLSSPGCPKAGGRVLTDRLAALPARRRAALASALADPLAPGARGGRSVGRPGASRPGRQARQAHRRHPVGSAQAAAGRVAHPTSTQFRAEQVLWGAAAGLAGVGHRAAGHAHPRGCRRLPSSCSSLAFVLVGVLARDNWLTRQARRREQRMLAEFPTVAELLALAVSAGEGAPVRSTAYAASRKRRAVRRARAVPRRRPRRRQPAERPAGARRPHRTGQPGPLRRRHRRRRRARHPARRGAARPGSGRAGGRTPRRSWRAAAERRSP